MKTGIELIAEERKRQIEEEEFTIEEDMDNNIHHQLARAAAVYALPKYFRENYEGGILHVWPWSRAWFKPTPENRVRELQKAGALIAAEIDILLNNKQSTK